MKWNRFPRASVDTLTEGQWYETLMSSLVLAWTNCWKNKRVAGDLVCHKRMMGRAPILCCLHRDYSFTINISRHSRVRGRSRHICVSKLIIIGSDNSLSPDRRQAMIWTNAGMLLIGPKGTHFNAILIKIHISLLKKSIIHLKMSSGKWRPFCLSLNVLTRWILFIIMLPRRCWQGCSFSIRFCTLTTVH